MLTVRKIGEKKQKDAKTTEDFCNFANARNDVIFFPITKYTVLKNESDFNTQNDVEKIIPFIHIPDSDIPDHKKTATIFMVWSKCDFEFFIFLVEREKRPQQKQITSEKYHAFFKNFMLWPCENFSHDSVRFTGKEILERMRIYFKIANDVEGEKGEGEEGKKNWSKEEHLKLQYLLIQLYSNNESRIHHLKIILTNLARKKGIDDEDINEMICKIDYEREKEKEQLPIILKCLSNYILDNL